MQTSAFWKDFGYTVRGWGLSLLIATALAVPLGILLGSSELASRTFRVPIEFLRPIPSAVLIPLLFLTLGSSARR
jgi:ABC-type nitrate/sulfonate/bicarbonate transport system permease component